MFASNFLNTDTMRNSLLLIASMLMLQASVFAQITITQADFVPPLVYDTAFIANETGFQTPPSGNDQTWKFTTLTKSNYAYITRFMDGSKDDAFDDDYSYRSATYSFQVFDFTGYAYMGYDKNGYYDYGRSIDRSPFSIAALTGGANDSLVFTAQKIKYNHRMDFVKFPMTVGDKWTQTRREPTPFELTVSGFGLNKTPGVSPRNRTDTREVIGHGTLQVPLDDGSTSAMMEVLMVKHTYEMEDSFYLNGQPAPAALMMAFGISQGMKQGGEYIEFYRKGFGSYVLRLEVTGGAVDVAAWDIAGARGLSTATQLVQARFVTSMYPNPAAAGSTVTLQTGFNIENFRLFDAGGREITNLSYKNSEAGKCAVNLPTGLQTGLYFYTATSANGAIVTQGKININ